MAWTNTSDVVGRNLGFARKHDHKADIVWSAHLLKPSSYRGGISLQKSSHFAMRKIEYSCEAQDQHLNELSCPFNPSIASTAATTTNNDIPGSSNSTITSQTVNMSSQKDMGDPFADQPAAYTPATITNPTEAEAFPVTISIKHFQLAPSTFKKRTIINKYTTAVELSPNTSFADLKALALQLFFERERHGPNLTEGAHLIKIGIGVLAGDAGLVNMSARNSRALLRIARDCGDEYGRAPRLEVEFGCACLECVGGGKKVGMGKGTVGKMLARVMGKVGDVVARL